MAKSPEKKGKVPVVPKPSSGDESRGKVPVVPKKPSGGGTKKKG